MEFLWRQAHLVEDQAGKRRKGEGDQGQCPLSNFPLPSGLERLPRAKEGGYTAREDNYKRDV